MASAPLINVYNISARRYAEFFDSIPAALFRTSIEGKIVYCNRAFARTFGFESALDLVDYPVIELYQNKKDRGVLVHSIMQRGRLVDVPIAFKKKDGTPLWCAMTARAILDDDGVVVNLDGMLRDITGEIDSRKTSPSLDEVIDKVKDIIILFDLQGSVIDINKSGADAFGVAKGQLLGKPISDFFTPSDRDLFLVYLSDILKIGRNEAILSIFDNSSRIRHLECRAVLVKTDGRARHIKCHARDVTEIVNQKKAHSNDEKFQGVLEMAGGVAHSMSQPLTIINNVLNEVLSDIRPDGNAYRKLVKVHQQITRMNDITNKIANIRKYEAMDYVAGIRIVDIEKAS
jgi:PAS domain S-box-containing protein